MNRSTRLIDYSMMALATVFGVGSIVLLLAMGSFTFVRLGWTESTLLGWDAALSIAFFVQHSVMVRRSFRTRLATVVPQRHVGAVYAIASGVVLAVVAVFWQRSENHLLVLQGISLWNARVCAVAALAVFIWSARAFRSFDPLGLGPIKAHLRGRPAESPRFVARGPSRWVRHPLYACIIVLIWCAPDLTADRLLFNVLWTGWIWLGAMLEERDLLREFGDAYRDYRRKVPMLIPWRGPVAL